MRVPSSSCSIFPRTLESLVCAGCLPAPYPACPNIAFLDGARSDVTPVTFAPFIYLQDTGMEQQVRVLNGFSRITTDTAVDLDQEPEDGGEPGPPLLG